MAEYIERNEVHKMVSNLQKYVWTSPVSEKSIVTVGADDVNFETDKIVAADVAPVVRGHWEPIIDPYGKIEGWLCECGRESKEMCNYCPNCGAKMDGERHE